VVDKIYCESILLFVKPIAFVSIATDRYIYFWVQLVQSALSHFSEGFEHHWYLFTDRKEDIPSEVLSALGERLHIFEIPHLKWPYPTLYRFRYIANISPKIEQDVVAYVDADMSFVADLVPKFAWFENSHHSLTFIRHPGFYRPTESRFRFYLAQPRIFLADLRRFTIYGNQGAWETREKSMAFVPRRLRQNYYCGGFWFGSKKAIQDMCEQLAERVDIDEENGVMAKFHDESHLNAYAVQHKHVSLEPSLCFDPSYPQLRNIEPILVAIDKNTKNKWER